MTRERQPLLLPEYAQQAYWQRRRATGHTYGHRNQMSHARCIRQPAVADDILMTISRETISTSNVLGLTQQKSWSVFVVRPQITTLSFTYSLKGDTANPSTFSFLSSKAFLDRLVLRKRCLICPNRRWFPPAEVHWYYGKYLEEARISCLCSISYGCDL